MSNREQAGLTNRQEADAIANGSGFWPVYPTDPDTRMQAAIQYPMTGASFAARVVDAYAVDNRNRLKSGRAALANGDEGK